MKHLWKVRTALVLASLLVLPRLALAAPIVIHLWYSQRQVETSCDGFNESQNEYRIVATRKGSYAETMHAGIAAVRAKNPPHILQVYEVGTATMMAAIGVIKPLYEVMQESGLPFDAGAYLPTISRYYSTRDGRLLSLPSSCSTPVLFYNKAMFRKAGLDPKKPPTTWPMLAEIAGKLLAAGVCETGFSSGWQSWIHIENLSAWHNVPIGTKDNGFGGLDAVYTFNGPLQVRHIQQLVDWQKDKIFFYEGRSGFGQGAFFSGKLAMYTGSSASQRYLSTSDQLDLGIAMLPYWPDVKGAPQNTIIGGNSLWVLQGHLAAEYKGVAAFFNYLSRPEVIAATHQSSGYVPITLAAYELTKKQGFYERNPGTEIPFRQLTLHEPTENSYGLRFGDHARTRAIMDNELDLIFTGRKTAQQGLDDAVKAGNEVLRKFEKGNQ